MSKLYKFALSFFGVNGLFAATNYSVDEIASYVEKSDTFIVFYDEQEIILNLEEYSNFENSVKKKQNQYEQEMTGIQSKIKEYNDELTNRNVVVSAKRKKELEEKFNDELGKARAAESNYKSEMQKLERDSSVRINSAKKRAITNILKAISEKINQNVRPKKKIIAINDSAVVSDSDDMHKRDITHLVVSNLTSSKGSSTVKNRGRK